MGYRRIVSTCLAFAIGAATAAPAAAAVTSSNTAQYARVLRTFNPRLTHAQSGALAAHVKTEAQFYRLDARLLVALVAIESSWHPDATSPVGAGGLGQLMPGTAAGLGVHAYSAFQNLNGTAHYLRGLLDRFSGYDQNTRYAYALAGYNAGPYAVERFGGIPPYTETRNYVRNVMGIWHQLSLSLSSHIDDSVHASKFSTAQRPVMIATAQARPALHKTAAIAAKRHAGKQRVPIMVADVSSLPDPVPTTAPKKKPFLYYVFHHPKSDAAQIADAANGMGPDPDAIDKPSSGTLHARTFALDAPATISGGHPIRVRLLTPASSPVTLIARIGTTVIAQTTLPARAKMAILKGIPAADLQRVVVLYAYARGFDEGHVAVTVMPKGAAIATR